MEISRKEGINDMKRKERPFWSRPTNYFSLWALGLVFEILGVYFFVDSAQSIWCDNFFMFVKSEKVLETGHFFSEDFVSMHSGLQTVFTQWLFAIPLTIVKDAIGLENLYSVAVALFLLNVFSLILVNKNIGKNSKNGLLLISFLLIYLAAITQGAIRPYYISAFLITMVYLLLEKYTLTGNWKYMLVMPVISILFINFHNNLYFGMYLPYCCFLGEWSVCKILKQKMAYNVTPILLSIPCCLLTSLVNPYGIKYVLFFFESMGAISPLIDNNVTVECTPIWDSLKLLCFFLPIFTIETIFVLKNAKKVPTRHLLCYFGFLIFFLRWRRNGIFFFTCGQIALFYILSTYEENINIRLENFCSKIALIVCCFGLLGSTFFYQTDKFNDGSHQYYFIKIASEIQKKENKENSTIYTEQYAGSYAAYLGLKPYIDACAENYGIAVNKKEDIVSEYVNTSVAYKIKKYKFDFVVCTFNLNDNVLYKNYKIIAQKDYPKQNVKTVLYQRIK